MSPRERPGQGQTEQPTDRAAGSDRTPFDTYPELHPIRLLAVDAAIYTFAIDAEVESELVVHLEETVATALVAAYAPFAAIARQTTRVADSARDAQLSATAGTAQAMAIRVAEVAAALQTREDASAIEVAQAASAAADRVAAVVAPGGEGNRCLCGRSGGDRRTRRRRSEVHGVHPGGSGRRPGGRRRRDESDRHRRRPECGHRIEGLRGRGRSSSHCPGRVLPGRHQRRRHRSGTGPDETVDQTRALNGPSREPG